jgi:hypothetical protein
MSLARSIDRTWGQPVNAVAEEDLRDVMRHGVLSALRLTKGTHPFCEEKLRTHESGARARVSKQQPRATANPYPYARLGVSTRGRVGSARVNLNKRHPIRHVCATEQMRQYALNCGISGS